MTTATKDAQAGFEDKTIEDGELEAALETMYHAKDDDVFRARVKKLNAAKKRVSESLQFHGIVDGQRLRCGEFILTGKARNGGGFSVPAWESIVAGGIEKE